MLLYLHRVLYVLACFSLSTAQGYCVNRTYFYVSSNGTNSRKCLTPANQSHPCSTLTYLTKNMGKGLFPHKHITQCFAIVILSDLTLNNSVVHLKSMNSASIVGASNITGPVTIHCEGYNSGMILDSVTNFTLYHLQFRGCFFNIIKYRIVSDYDLPSYLTAVWVSNSNNVSILESSFENHRGSSILMENVYNVTVAKSNFTGISSLLGNMRSCSGGIIVRLSKDPFSFFNHSAQLKFNIHSCSFFSTCNLRVNDNPSKNKTSDQRFHQYGGAIDVESFIVKSLLNFSVNKCKFKDNVASIGGAISFFVSASHHTNLSISNSLFSYNKAVSMGGAVSIHHDKPARGHLDAKLVNCKFLGNSANLGGAVAAFAPRTVGCIHKTDITFINTSFVSNTANTSGFAIAMGSPDMHIISANGDFCLTAFFSGHTLITNNHGGIYGAVTCETSALFFESNSVSNISNNTGTAIVLVNSELVFNGAIQFSNNSGTIGAAIYIKWNSFVIFNYSSSSYFVNNRVSVYGGAIYSRVTGYCALQRLATAHVTFYHNYANLLEQSIYIAKSSTCNHSDYYSYFKFVPHVASQVLFPLSTIDIVFEPVIKKVMLGEKFVLKPTKMLDVFGRASIGMGYIRFQNKAQNNSSDTAYKLRGPSTIILDDYTRNLEFFVVGPNVIGNEEVEIDVYYKSEESTYEVSKFEIMFEIVPCRIGFKYSPNNRKCDCEARSSASQFQCHTHRHLLCVRRHYWYSTDFHTTYPCPAQNCLFVHNQCPSKSATCNNSTEYCGIQKEDDVCREGRSGFLCSECASNYSFTFSGVQCTSSTSCHPWSTFLQLLALIVYWILFVVVLVIGLSLNLGVGSGFMFGIVYFFSVVTIYIRSSDLYTVTWIRILLYVDMAIAQCDPELLGYVSSTCFAETWRNPLAHEFFRYATPIFVILIIVFLIIFSRYCRVPKFLSLAENSPIHAICLLILFNYTSISYTSLKLLVPLKVKDGLRVQVAPTISYFSKEHIPYAVVGICAELFFCLPICVLFLFAPLISRRVNLVKLRLKPIVDEFQACYKPEYRYFAGFYFLSRQIVYLISLMYLGPFPQFNYILTTVNILILLIHVFYQPYSQKWLNILDTILLTDIVVLSQLSPVKVKSNVESTSSNEFFYDILIPYALILFPSIYLFIALSLIFVKKFFSICFRFSAFARLTESRLGMLLRPVLLKINTTLNLESTGLQSPISGSSVREPLLEELHIERSNLTTSLYGSTRSRQSFNKL